mgnify:FL=1
MEGHASSCPRCQRAATVTSTGSVTAFLLPGHLGGGHPRSPSWIPARAGMTEPRGGDWKLGGALYPGDRTHEWHPQHMRPMRPRGPVLCRTAHGGPGPAQWGRHECLPCFLQSAHGSTRQAQGSVFPLPSFPRRRHLPVPYPFTTIALMTPGLRAATSSRACFARSRGYSAVIMLFTSTVPRRIMDSAAG